MNNFERRAWLLSEMERLCLNQNRLLILLHDNPDPDALASGWALNYLVREAFGVKARLAYGGFIGRAENRAMVRILNIPLSRVERIRFSAYDRIALLDSQPGAKNNALPGGVQCDLVIDHHPRRRGMRAGVVFIDTEVGATATLLVEGLIEAGLSIPADLGTALSYAIRSETQDLGREASARDIHAYLEVLPRASMRKLAHIVHPKLPKVYFSTLVHALRHAKSYRNLVSTHIGEVPYPEIIAEVADFLLMRERISWSFCTGRYGDSLFLSLRSTNMGARAGRLLRRMVSDRDSAGGHDTFAGGKISLLDFSQQEKEQTERHLTERLVQLLGYDNAEWKPFIEPSPQRSSLAKEVS